MRNGTQIRTRMPTAKCLPRLRNVEWQKKNEGHGRCAGQDLQKGLMKSNNFDAGKLPFTDLLLQ